MFWLLGFKVYWLPNFKVSKIYQITIYSFLEDLDIQDFQDLLDGSSGCSVLVFSNISRSFEFHFRDSQKEYLPKMIWDFLDYLMSPGVSKDN